MKYTNIWQSILLFFLKLGLLSPSHHLAILIYHLIKISLVY